MGRILWRFITSLQTQIVVLIAGVLGVFVSFFVYYDVTQQREMLEKTMFEKGEALAISGAATIKYVFEDAIATGQLTEGDLFVPSIRTLQEIPGTNPQKYHSPYDSFTDANLPAILDSYLSSDDVQYAVAVDVLGYVPTHNTRTSDRGKAIYYEKTAIKNAVLNEDQTVLRELYDRDIGTTWNISAPIYVNGRHWGAFMVGFSVERSKQITQDVVERIRNAAIALVLGSAVIAFVISYWISNPIRKLRNATATMAQGDLTRGITLRAYNNEVGELVAALNSVIAAWRGIIGGLRDDALRLSTTAAELAASSEELSRTTAAQSTEIGRTASAVEEMAASIRQVAQNAEKAAETSALSSQRAEGGGKLTHETANALERADRSMQQLRARSQEIGKIVQLIQEIASQTNILALNAAIEAAGAGVAGARFDVVAEEIRQLAGRTSQATGEIAELINAVRAETQTAAEAISKSTTMAQESGASLSDIVASSVSVNDMVHNISAATSEQSLASAEIANSVDTMVSGSQQTALATRETAQIGVELSNLAERLKEAANRFKV